MLATEKQYRSLIVRAPFTKGFVMAMSASAVTCMVDYTLPFYSMIEKAQPDRVSDHITRANFPSPNPLSKMPQQIEFQLVHFDCKLRTEQVLLQLGGLNLRPATLQELCALGATRVVPKCIAALGSQWEHEFGSIGVPILNEDARYRYLYLGWDGHRRCWNEYFLFLAASK